MKNYNPFLVLGLDDQSDINQVKERYRELSKVFHPDKQSVQNYDEAKKQFHKIDRAYKTLSTKFNMIIFEFFGMDGVKLVVNNHSKFEDLEKNFNGIHDQKNEIKSLVKKIRSRIRNLQFKLLEKEYYTKTFRKIEIYPSFYAGNEMIDRANDNSYILHNYWFAFQRKQELITHISLPKFKQIDQDFYVYISHTESMNGVQKSAQEYGHKGSCRLQTQRFGLLNFSSQIGRSEDQFHGMLDISKQLPFNIQASLQFKYMQNQITPNLSLSCQDLNNNINLWISQDGLNMVGTKFGFKECDIEITAMNNSISVSSSLIVEKHKYYTTSIVLQDYNDYSLVSSRLCKPKELQLQMEDILIDATGNQKHYWSWKQSTRINLHALSFKNFKPSKAILFLLPFLLPFLWNYRILKPQWQQRVQIKQKKRAQELDQLKKINLQVQDKISQDEEFIRNLQRESGSHGLVILEAYIGLRDNIDRLNKNPLCINLEEKRALFVPCKNQIQLMVMQGYLFLQGNSVQLLPGMYLADTELPISEYKGYILYKFEGQQKCQTWYLSDDLSIGYHNKTLSRFSLVQWLIQYVF